MLCEVGDLAAHVWVCACPLVPIHIDKDYAVGLVSARLERYEFSHIACLFKEHGTHAYQVH